MQVLIEEILSKKVPWGFEKTAQNYYYKATQTFDTTEFRNDLLLVNWKGIVSWR